VLKWYDQRPQGRFGRLWLDEDAIAGAVQVQAPERAVAIWKNKEDITKGLTAKAQPWDYEKEVRIIRRTEGLQAIEKSYLKQICFGLATPDQDISLVRKLIDQSDYNVTICKIDRTKESYFGLKVLEI